MTINSDARSASTLAGMGAALFCTFAWLGGGLALLGFQVLAA